VSVVDMVVHASVKTPTAAAEWLIERVAEQVEIHSELQLRLQRAVQTAIVAQQNHLLQYEQRLSMAVGQMVMREQSRFDLWQKTIELHSPDRIFRMGYSLTTVNGNLVHRLEDVQAGDVLQTYLQDGVIESVVK
jgi:exodeoxyribonuclease VII large subunit